MTDSNNYMLNHTMLRVTDPEASLKFYKHLGMSLLKKFELPDYKLDLYFVGFDHPNSSFHGNDHTDREGVIELSHDYSFPKGLDFQYHNGNEEPRGFGHIGISVDSPAAVCDSLSAAGYRIEKGLADGRSPYIAYVLDPDGYRVGIVAQEGSTIVQESNVQTYKMNFTMLRIKDKDASIAFYTQILGMQVQHITERPDLEFDLIILGYGNPSAKVDLPEHINSLAGREGLLTLTWNYGTEKEDGPVYHHGNSEPFGFGHIGVSVDNIQLVCDGLNEKGVRWQKRLEEGEWPIAFLLDPDGYWIEIIQNAKLIK